MLADITGYTSMLYIYIDDSELNIDHTEWEKATEAVNKVLNMLITEIQKEAAKYEGLVIEKYVKQGEIKYLKLKEKEQY